MIFSEFASNAICLRFSLIFPVYRSKVACFVRNLEEFVSSTLGTCCNDSYCVCRQAQRFTWAYLVEHSFKFYLYSFHSSYFFAPQLLVIVCASRSSHFVATQRFVQNHVPLFVKHALRLMNWHFVCLFVCSISDCKALGPCLVYKRVNGIGHCFVILQRYTPASL